MAKVTVVDEVPRSLTVDDLLIGDIGVASGDAPTPCIGLHLLATEEGVVALERPELFWKWSYLIPLTRIYRAGSGTKVTMEL